MKLIAATVMVVAICGFVGAQTSTPADEQPLKPNLKWTTVEAYSAEIGEPGVLLQSDHLWLFAPRSREKEAGIIFNYLVKAYDELYRIVGVHTKYKLIVYHLPKGFGGTSECVIEYDYTNLDLDKSDEWKRHKVPHVSGYIEEMAHNFVSTTKAQFGWEMIGWSIGVKVTQKVAPNPTFNRQVQETRQKQAQTFARYNALGQSFPPDVESNLCDRIHAHLLYQCEQRYGAAFWQDFFSEVRVQRKPLDDAVHLAGGDNIRNERYRITVECFDKLKGLQFKKMLERYGISTTVDAKSLATKPDWNRKFAP
jgi:hypothetical protein